MKDFGRVHMVSFIFDESKGQFDETKVQGWFGPKDYEDGTDVQLIPLITDGTLMPVPMEIEHYSSF